MPDSFFSTRNGYDESTAQWNKWTCVGVLDATTRRLAELEGPIATSRRHYRLADICAGAHLMPLESLKQAKEETPPAPEQKTSWIARRKPLFWLLLGHLSGAYLAWVLLT